MRLVPQKRHRRPFKDCGTKFLISLTNLNVLRTYTLPRISNVRIICPAVVRLLASAGRLRSRSSVLNEPPPHGLNLSETGYMTLRVLMKSESQKTSPPKNPPSKKFSD